MPKGQDGVKAYRGAMSLARLFREALKVGLCRIRTSRKQESLQQAPRSIIPLWRVVEVSAKAFASGRCGLTGHPARSARGDFRRRQEQLT